MVWEDQVTAAAVEIKGAPQVFRAHGRAFNVPARAAFAPRAVPGRFARFGRFPKGKVHRVFLAFIHVNAGTGHHVVQRAAG